MKTFYNSKRPALKQLHSWLWLFALAAAQTAFGQSATVNNPLAIGQNCGGGGNNFKSFTYDSTTRKLTQIGSNCNPSLQSPGFNPGGGSIAFSPKDQKVYYIETTTGNNSIVWSWTPGTCPVSNQAPIYTYASTFIVGLEFNAQTGDGYQLEFSTGSAPYNIYLRKVTSFAPLTTGAVQQIMLPAGKKIWQQNGDIVITPTGSMYFILNNKMFSLDYSTYGTGVLNANFIDTIKNGAGNNVIGLSYAAGKFITSVSNSGSTCFYNQIDISSGVADVKSASVTSGTFIAYDMATMVTGIGVAKKLSSLSLTGTNQYKVVYDIKVRNYGNVNLTAVQVMDSVKKVFGTSFVSASLAAVGTMPAGLTLNPLYDGNTVCSIFAAGSTMKATPSDSATVRITVDLNNPNILTTYFNSAIATGTGTIFSNNVRDSSDNQASLNPDVSGTDIPDFKGEGVPTPITPVTWLLLPNKVVDFNAKRSGDLVNISWSLDNQEAGTTTQLQRSADGISFENLVTLGSRDASHQDYSWQDKHPLSSNNYYRLQLISPGGSKLYSGVVIIRKLEEQTVITASPNPFLHSFRFSLDLEKAGKLNYRIRNFTGSVMQSGTYNAHEGSNEIEISSTDNMPAGNYILEINAGEKYYYRKMVKL